MISDICRAYSAGKDAEIQTEVEDAEEVRGR